MDLIAIGEILIDLTQTGISPAGIPQFSANPGGAPANLAVGQPRGWTLPPLLLAKWEMTALVHFCARRSWTTAWM